MLFSGIISVLFKIARKCSSSGNKFEIWAVNFDGKFQQGGKKTKKKEIAKNILYKWVRAS